MSEVRKVSIIIPMYNEALAIREVLMRVCNAPLPQGMEKEIILVDDGSTDSSLEVVKEFTDQHSHLSHMIRLHTGLVNHGKGSALRAGFKLATGEIILIQDGDLEYDPKDYPILLEPFSRRDVDIVFGSRFLNGMPPGMKFPNLIANIILSFTTRVLYGNSITDEATGYKVFRASVLKQINLKCRGFEFCPEFLGKVLQAGYRIHEVPIHYNPRGILEGKKIKARDGFIAIYWLFKIRLKRLVPVKKNEGRGQPKIGFLDEPAFLGLEVGSREWFQVQREVIRKRPLLKHTYDLWYNSMLQDEAGVGKDRPGLLVELGSGGSYLKELKSEIITSDVVSGIADRVIDARKLPFEDEKVRALFLTHSFHHIPNVEKFLEEAQRVLVDGGTVSMIEVAKTPFAQFFFKRFHPEPYDPDAQSWAFPAHNNAMVSANQALSWIVFFRDKEKFEKDFPHLRLEKRVYLPWLGYLVSGGVTKRNMVPNFLGGLVSFFELCLSPLRPFFSLHWHLTVRKVGQDRLTVTESR